MTRPRHPSMTWRGRFRPPRSVLRRPVPGTSASVARGRAERPVRDPPHQGTARTAGDDEDAGAGGLAVAERHQPAGRTAHFDAFVAVARAEALTPFRGVRKLFENC